MNFKKRQRREIEKNESKMALPYVESPKKFNSKLKKNQI